MFTHLNFKIQSNNTTEPNIKNQTPTQIAPPQEALQHHTNSYSDSEIIKPAREKQTHKATQCNDISRHQFNTPNQELQASNQNSKQNSQETLIENTLASRPKSYSNFWEFMSYFDKKSQTFISLDPEKHKLRCQNIYKLWQSLSLTRKATDPSFKEIYLKYDFTIFFGRMLPYVFNALYAENTTPTMAVLNRVRDEIELMRDAFKNEVMSHIVIVLFECLHKAPSIMHTLDISRNFTNAEIVQCFLQMLIHYYQDFKKKPATCMDSALIFDNGDA